MQSPFASTSIPTWSCFRDNKGRLVLAPPQADRWFFSSDIAPRVEESIFFAAVGGPRRSRQIVLYCNASERPQVSWQLEKRRREAAE